jgi:glycosyltransferase involved in cell wall biosynthesis
MKLRISSTSFVKDAFMPKAAGKVCLFILRPLQRDYRTLRTIAALQEGGFAVSVVDIACERAAPRDEVENGVKWHHLVIPQWYSARRFQLLFFLVAIKTFLSGLYILFKSDADVYHAVELTALPVCYIAAKLRRKPLVFEAYELHVPVAETDVAFWRRLGPRFLALLLPRCTRVITTTPFYAEEFRKRFHVYNVSLIRNIPVYRTVQKSDLLRQHLGLSEGTRIALYQGNLQRNRGLDKLVRAATFLERDIVIVLMGKGDREQLEELIVHEKVADRVKIIPPVPLYDDLLNWTASADIGLITYTPEYSLAVKLILPNKLFEYIMAGVPVLATDLDAVVDIIKTYDVGQVVALATPEAIGKAINTMLFDHKKLECMHCNALNAARRELYWEKESQELIRLYNEIL